MLNRREMELDKVGREAVLRQDSVLGEDRYRLLLLEGVSGLEQVRRKAVIDAHVLVDALLDALEVGMLEAVREGQPSTVLAAAPIDGADELGDPFPFPDAELLGDGKVLGDNAGELPAYALRLARKIVAQLSEAVRLLDGKVHEVVVVV